MAELTQEYFEQHLKQELISQTKELKQFAEEQTDSLARIIATTVAEPMEQRFQQAHRDHEELSRIVADGFVDVVHRLDHVDRIEEPEKEMKQIKEALHLNPSGV